MTKNSGFVKNKTLKLGTRGSALALTQSRWVASRLEEACEGLRVELLVIKTTGDQQTEAPLSTLGGKGVFTREIEVALLAGEVDFAVHSLKDLPTELPEGLRLASFPPREDARDALVALVPLAELPEGAVVGTGSLRRQCQLEAARPDLEIRHIRGNVPTRVKKWRQGDYQAVVLAMSGIRRLGLEKSGLVEAEIHPLDPEVCVPAPAQGILGLECREGDQSTLDILDTIADADAEVAARAERAFLRRLEGGCNVPAGAWAQVLDGGLLLEAALGNDAGALERVRLAGSFAEAEELGVRAAEQLLEAQGQS